jgi:hypothetical protein
MTYETNHTACNMLPIVVVTTVMIAPKETQSYQHTNVRLLLKEELYTRIIFYSL